MSHQSIIIAILLSCTSALFAQELPAGFKSANGSFDRFEIILPEAWHYKEITDKENSISCYISKENIDTDGGYSTGVTIFVLKNIKETMRMNGASFALRHSAEAFAKEGIIVNGFNGQLRSHGMACSFGYVDPNDGSPIETFNVVLEVTEKNEAVIIVCEAPQAEFQSFMQLIKPTLSNIAIQ